MSQKTLNPLYDLIMDEDLEKNQYPKRLQEIQNSKAPKSLMAQVMNKEIFDKYKNIKTGQGKWTIARAINTGTTNSSSFVGCHAGDKESYDIFKEFFTPVIEKYHKGFNMKTDKHITDLDDTKIQVSLEQNSQDKIVSTRIRVARNLDFFPMNPSGTLESRLQIADLMEKVFNDLEGEFEGKFFRHTSMTDQEKQALIDEHLLFRGADKMQASSGYHQYWPQGRGIFHNFNKTFIVWVNEGDHLRIISMEKGGDVQSVFSKLSRGVAEIEKRIQYHTQRNQIYSVHNILGNITCCPSNLGTGMRVSVHIKLPYLIQKIGLEGIDDIARSMNCQARGSSGEHSEVIDKIDISNWRRLGFSGWVLVQDMIECVNYLSKMEQQKSITAQINPKL